MPVAAGSSVPKALGMANSALSERRSRPGAPCRTETRLLSQSVCPERMILHGSRRQPAEQPSPDTVLPSSHCSPASTTPSPQRGSRWQVAEQPSPETVLPSSHCSPSCRLEVCGNHILDPGEQCDDGNTVSGDGCSAACQREPRCGDGVVDPGEQCDDGNTVSGDGCSAACRLEPCKIMRSGQTLWLRSLLAAQHGGSGSDRLSLRAEFAIPSAFGTLDPAATGMSLLVEDAAGGGRLRLPPPPRGHGDGRRGR